LEQLALAVLIVLLLDQLGLAGQVEHKVLEDLKDQVGLQAQAAQVVPIVQFLVRKVSPERQVVQVVQVVLQDRRVIKDLVGHLVHRVTKGLRVI
jgi:hypothetical protein